jgi:hypothetical protein
VNRFSLVAALAFACSAAAPAAAIPLFDKEAAIVLSSVTAQAFTGDTGGAAYAPLRMYYLPAISSGAPHASSGTAILSATSIDGVAFTAEAGVRVDTNTTPTVSASSITGCSVTPLQGGGFRMMYSIVSTTGAFRIHTTTSADGLAWGNQAAVAVDGGAVYVGVPRVVVLNSGDWRMYYTRDSLGTGALSSRRIFTTRSADEGATWGASSIAVSTTAYEAGASKLTDGRVRLFFTQPPAGLSSATVIGSALSSDILANSFSIESGLRITTPTADGGLAFPVPVRATDTFRWRLYYSFFALNSSTGDLRSALVGRPAPDAVTPTLVFSNSGPVQYTISGDGFSTTPTATLRLGALNFVDAAPVRNSDQSITATFNLQNQTLGTYDLIVTNADGVPGTLPSAVTLDFAPGFVLMTNNLLRPRTGGTTAIDITTFVQGRVGVRIIDSEGREIRTLFDAEQPAGTFRVNWDGKTATGAAASSGIYLAVITGPKLKSREKIVIVR